MPYGSSHGIVLLVEVSTLLNAIFPWRGDILMRLCFARSSMSMPTKPQRHHQNA